MLRFDRAQRNSAPAAPTHGDDRLRIAGAEGVLEVHGAEGRVAMRGNAHFG